MFKKQNILYLRNLQVSIKTYMQQTSTWDVWFKLTVEKLCSQASFDSLHPDTASCGLYDAQLVKSWPLNIHIYNSQWVKPCLPYSHK